MDLLSVHPIQKDPQKRSSSESTKRYTTTLHLEQHTKHQVSNTYKQPHHAASLTTHPAPKGPKHGNHLLLESFTPAARSDEDFNNWYRKQHIPDLAKLPTYLCTARYKLIRSQAFVENLPRGKMHWASPPTYLALHEFGGEGLDSAALDVGMEGDWDRKIREGIQSAEISVYTLHPLG